MIFVGADVHGRHTYFHATDANGNRWAHGRRGSTPAELETFCESLLQKAGGEVRPVRFVLESTTHSRAVQRMLCQAGTQAGFDAVTADVLDARKLRIIAESVVKCDAIDARVLNELSRANLTLPTCDMPDDEEFALREHLRARNDLVRVRTMMKNRIHAIMHRRGLLSPKEGIFTGDGRKFLNEITLDEAGRSILTRYLKMLDELDTR